jgi:hypothetical protein
MAILPRTWRWQHAQAAAFAGQQRASAVSPGGWVVLGCTRERGGPARRTKVPLKMAAQSHANRKLPGRPTRLQVRRPSLRARQSRFSTVTLANVPDPCESFEYSIRTD